MKINSIKISNIYSFGFLEDINSSEGVSFEGNLNILIGPNGAGKSTLFRLISGLLPLQSGSIEVGGYSIKDQLNQAKREQMLLTDNPDVYPFLTGSEFINMHASLRGISQSTVKKDLPKIKKSFPGLNNLNELIGEQSRGNKQKIQIITALLTKPNILLSDEPIVGLDPSSIISFGEIIKEFKNEKRSVLLALHTLEFAQKYADRVGVLNKGKLTIISDNSKTDLYKLYQKYTIQ